MRILISKILIVFLFFSFLSELTVNVFAKGETVISLVESEESKEENKEKEEINDKISSEILSVLLSTVSGRIFYDIHTFRTSAFRSLPEIPPDLA